MPNPIHGTIVLAGWEKIDVLTNYYNGKIQEGVKQLNGGDSKS